jgi:hypothetical protein
LRSKTFAKESVQEKQNSVSAWQNGNQNVQTSGAIIAVNPSNGAQTLIA